MLKKTVLGIIGLGLLTAGCTSTVVKPQDVVTIRMCKDNAQAINTHVQTYTTITATLPDGSTTDITSWVKRWWSSEVKAWANLENWATGQPAVDTIADPFAK